MYSLQIYICPFEAVVEQIVLCSLKTGNCAEGSHLVQLATDRHLEHDENYRIYYHKMSALQTIGAETDMRGIQCQE